LKKNKCLNNLKNALNLSAFCIPALQSKAKKRQKKHSWLRHTNFILFFSFYVFRVHFVGIWSLN